jgi:hypothetical protein
LSKFYSVDKSYYTRYWPLLLLLFIAVILAWWQISSLLAAILAGSGFVFMLVTDRRAKNRDGNSIEVLDKCIVFNHGNNSSSIAFNEIKKVKYSSTLSPGEQTIVIETGINKLKFQPSDYDNSSKLLQQLENKFTTFNCPVVK